MTLTRFISGMLITAGLATAGVVAHAADPWPSKPIRFIVPYAAGGASDITARLLAQHMSTALGQPVVIDNRTGAGGNIGTDMVAKAAPDGYTIVLAYTGPMGINPYLYKNLPFNPSRDFAPVAQVADAPLVMVVNASLPVKNIPELVAYAKANPEKVFCGSSGVGGADHLACELFKSRTATGVSAIGYKGGAPAMLDLVAGRTQMQFATIPGALAHIRSGAIRPLAILSNRRFSLFPEVPTIAEAGMQNFDITNWYGVSVPTGTPPAIIKRLSSELNVALQQAPLRARFQELGLVPAWSSTEDFTAYIKADAARWEPIVRSSGATLD
ncbi:MAG: tripartite tricarboxylate transporter substrate binding protein [Comamonadaceae bacterium]|nr:MAG: tripartite tricarboxylate transporter substrate binding protein [Comamonadaceae bacterium]